MGTKRTVLTFVQQTQVRDFILANRVELEVKEMSKESMAALIASKMMFDFNSNHLKTILDSIDPPLKFSEKEAAYPAYKKRVEDLEQLVADLVTQCENTTTAVIECQSRIEQAFTLIGTADNSLRTLQATNTETAAAIAKIRSDLERAMTEIGFKKLNDALAKVCV